MVLQFLYIEREVTFMIGSKLQEILNKKGSNPAELSRLTGISYQTIVSIIKRDNLKINLDYLFKICNALDVNIETFYMEYEEYRNKKSKTSPKINLLIEKAEQLNEDGLLKLTDIADDLVSSKKYEKIQINERAM